MPRALLACLAVLAVLLTAACGDDGGEEAQESTTTSRDDDTTTTPPTTELTPEEEVEAVYLEFVETLRRLVTSDPNPDDPELARLASEPVLGTIRDSLTTQETENQVWQEGDGTSHDVISASVENPTTATVIACAVESDRLIDRDDGSVVRGGRLTTRTLQVTVLRSGNRWTVSEVETLERVPGDVECNI